MCPKMLQVLSQGSWDTHTRTHMYTLYGPWLVSLGLQQGRQCRQETHPQNLTRNLSPTQSQPWDRPQIGLFSALAAFGNGDNRLCLHIPASTYASFFLCHQAHGLQAPALPHQPTAGTRPSQETKRQGLQRIWKKGERSCLLLARRQGDGPNEPGGPGWRGGAAGRC